MTDRVLILDFGSQVTQLIARRVRESGVYCEIQPFNVGADGRAPSRRKAIILSGGPASVPRPARRARRRASSISACPCWASAMAR